METLNMDPAKSFLTANDVTDSNILEPTPEAIGDDATFITPQLLSVGEQLRSDRDFSPEYMASNSPLEQISDFHTVGTRLIHSLVPNFKIRQMPLNALSVLCETLITLTDKK